MLFKKNIEEKEKIQKSKEIIKKEKLKIKEEKKKIKTLKRKKFQKTKIGKILSKVIPKTNFIKNKSILNQIFTIIYLIISGFILCLLLFFILSGGKNYIKLYYELSKLIDTYDTVTSNYYGDLSKDDLIDNAIDSMISSVGDDYTTYSDSNSTSTFLENVEGTYEGIGCTVAMNEDNNIVVVEVFKESPAEKAGLKEKDIILKVDNKDFTKKTNSDVSEYVKNSNKSKINFTIKRESKELTLVINRKKVEVPSVTSKTYKKSDNNIGYINISIFSSVTTSQFKKSLEKLEKDDKIKGLIIDVRNNSGGYLTTVTDISNMLLKKNQIIYQLQNDKKIIKEKDKTKEHRTYPIVVLINDYSASASEILASAILESYGGEVVGINSFGKGTVQKTKILSDGSMIKYTTQKWLTPNGNWINKIGVTPSKVVEFDVNSKEDNQLNEALKIIEEKLKK